MTALADVVSGQALWQWQQTAKQQAQTANVAIAEVDWFLQSLTGLDRLSLRLASFRHQKEIPLSCSFTDLQALWQQRLQARVPIQYLVGSTSWRNFSLHVAPGVLIPRPETELIIEIADQACQLTPALRTGQWADLGTGSGAIALGLAEIFPQATLHAVDCSPIALDIAQQNAHQLGFGDRLQFYLGQWFAPLSHLQARLSGMVSNPPYIPSAIIPTLQPEVAQHEPQVALDGGEDGLTCIRQLVQQAPAYLVPEGIWLIELMAGQAQAVTAALRAQGNYHAIEIYPDLAGIDRFVLARRNAV